LEASTYPSREEEHTHRQVGSEAVLKAVRAFLQDCTLGLQMEFSL
jgi:hypothetical protein